MLASLDLHVVRPGDTLTRIAKRYGVADWRSIYFAPENAEFRRKRPNPDRIFPGDEIVVVRQGPSFDLPPGPPPIGGTPPPAPPDPAVPTLVENTDFILTLPRLQFGKVGFDVSDGAKVHPHDQRTGVRPWLLLPLRRPRELELVRRNTSAPTLSAAEVRFTTLRVAEQRPRAGAGLGVMLTGTGTGVGLLRAVHGPTGRPLASAQVEGVDSVTHAGALLVSLTLHDVRSGRSEAEIRGAFAAANAVFLEQANVRWGDAQLARATTVAKPGGALDAADLDAVWHDVRGKLPGRRHVVVFFVQKLTDAKSDGATPVAGAHVGTADRSLRGLIAVSDMAVRPHETLTHELGHLCGLDLGEPAHPSSRQFNRNVMFRKGDVVRDTFYRDQIELIRKLPP